MHPSLRAIRADITTLAVDAIITTSTAFANISSLALSIPPALQFDA